MHLLRCSRIFLNTVLGSLSSDNVSRFGPSFFLSSIFKTSPTRSNMSTVTHTQEYTHIHGPSYFNSLPELSVPIRAAGYTCESLLHDIGIKDLSALFVVVYMLSCVQAAFCTAQWCELSLTNQSLSCITLMSSLIDQGLSHGRTCVLGSFWRLRCLSRM